MNNGHNTASTDKLLVWKKPTWLHVFTLYHRLLEYLTHDVNFMCMFVSSVEPAEIDYVARCIVNIFAKTGYTLELINAMIYNEFSKAANEGEGSVMRGNNIINKIEGIYVRDIGSTYLKQVVGELVTKIATDTKLNLEIDPRRINLTEEQENIMLGASSPGLKSHTSDPGMTVESVIAQNQKKLMEYAQAFLDRITDPKLVEEMPKEIKQIAAKTAQCAKKFTPDSLNPLIGGFIMLRFFSPAIATPESSKLLPPDVTPSPRAKRNLVLLAKVLQNASNGLLFGAKEEFMTCMNEFINNNKSKMHQYFADVCKDAPVVSNRARIERYVASVAKSAPANGSTNGSNPSSNGSNTGSNSIGAVYPTLPSSEARVKQTIIGNKKPASSLAVSPTPSSTSPSAPATQTIILNTSEIDMKSIDLQDIFDLHRVLDATMEKVKVKHAAQKATAPISDDELSLSWIDNFARISTVLKELGPSPKTRHQSRKAKVDQEEEREPVNARLQSNQMMFEDVMAVLERARFLYQGPNDKQDCPVFYLIVNRIKPEFLDNINPLVSHIFKVMDEVVNNGYSLVIDMSWASVNNELKRVVYAHLPNLAKIFSRRYKKNVLGIYIVHPSAYTRAVVHFMRFFTSRKLKRKIVEIYNWKQLTKLIDTDNILLPETSKDYITKSYKLIKVNAKGKKQERLIKFTANSLLNIDPKTKKLQNEKRIDEIEEMSSADGSADLDMRFDMVEKPTVAKKALPFSFSTSNDKDQSSRRYICNNIQERDSILQDIYEMSFKNHWMKPPPEFKVTKVNQAGKHQERVFKLTIDSLLNLNNNQIKSETSFAGIEGVFMDPVEPDTAWIKLKAENYRRKIICSQANLLVEHLNEAVKRYTQVVGCEEDNLKQDLEEDFAS